MREPKPSWVRALRDLTGFEQDDIRFNEALHRWEFLLTCADGKLRSQFWGHFGKPIDEVTGLHPFRELDDEGMRVALANLTKTYVGNRHDGAGTPEAEIRRRMKFNAEHKRQKFRTAGELFADMAADRGHRLRGAAFTGSGGSVAGAARKIITPAEA